MISAARVHALAPLLLAASLSGQSPQPSVSETLAITHVTVVDTTGGPLQSDMTVEIRDGRITGLEKTSSTKRTGRQELDGHGKYLIPGLWDMHVHLCLAKASALPVFLATGVTGVRDMGGRLGEIDDWRMKIAEGILAGPRIMRVGPILNGQSFNSLQLVPGSPDGARAAARMLKHVGVDFIKIHRRIPKDSYLALLDEAKKLEMTVVGHIPMTVTPEEASDAGQYTFEHTETLFEGTFTAALKDEQLSQAVRRFLTEQADRLFARFVRNHSVVTPTLVAYRSIIESSDPSFSFGELERYIPASMRRPPQTSATSPTPEELAELKQTFAVLHDVVKEMNRVGVTLMAGTDTSIRRVPGFTLHDELLELVQSGLTPLQALQAATLNPAVIMKRPDDFGSVSAGKIADLILLDANPLDDIRNTRRITAVVFGGRLLRRSDLDALLKLAEQLAGKS